jgi:Flp pilus assembly protein TadG
MGKILVLVGVCSLLLGLSAGGVFCQDLGGTIAITVSPNVVNTSAKGQWVTIHAEIPYSAVATASVFVNGVPVDWTKSDNQGDLVAKFCLDNVLAVISPPSATLTLNGTTIGNVPFSGTDTVKVVTIGDKR